MQKFGGQYIFFFKELCSIKNHEEKKIEFSEHLWSAHIM